MELKKEAHYKKLMALLLDVSEDDILPIRDFEKNEIENLLKGLKKFNSKKTNFSNFDILKLRLEGLTFKAIGKELGVCGAAVNNRFYQALRKSRHEMITKSIKSLFLLSRSYLEKNISELLKENESLKRQIQKLEKEKKVFMTRKTLLKLQEKELAQIKIKDTELSIRTSNALKKNNILTLKDLLETSEAGILKIENFSRKSMNEIKSFFSWKYNLSGEEW